MVQSVLASEEGDSLGVNQGVVDGALEGLRVAVDLWKGQEFTELYGRGTEESRRQISEELFSSLMKKGTRQLQCCWTTIQDLEGFYDSPTQVYVRVKLAYENYQDTPVNTQGRGAGFAQWMISSSFDPRTFLMVLQEGTWRMDLNEVLMASGHSPESLRFTGRDPR